MKELAEGTVLANRYEIVTAMRAGGMGAVYRAIDRHFDRRDVALKQMLDPEGRGDPEVLHRRFTEEANVLVNLSHPGVPQVYDFFSEHGSHFIAMEFIHGDSLDTLLDDYMQLTGLPMPQAEAVHYGVQVAEVLTYLHTLQPQAILHRDVKPSNIVRNMTTRRAVLVDFGLARDTNASNTATLVGTLGYAAYEQVVGKPDPRSDIYGLGATLWHLVTGKIPPPFEVPPLREVVPDIDPELARLVDWATRYEVVDRPPSALVFADGLRELKLRLEMSRTVHTTVGQEDGPRSSSRRLARDVDSPVPAAPPPPPVADNDPVEVEPVPPTVVPAPPPTPAPEPPPVQPLERVTYRGAGGLPVGVILAMAAGIVTAIVAVGFMVHLIFDLGSKH